MTDTYELKYQMTFVFPRPVPLAHSSTFHVSIFEMYFFVPPPCLSLSNCVSLSFSLAAQELQVRFLTLSTYIGSCKLWWGRRFGSL